MKKGGIYKYETTKTKGWRILWRNADGKQESKTILNATRSEALAERRKILVAIDLGDHVSKSKLKFIDFAHTFLKLKRGTLGVYTYKEYVRFFTTKSGKVIQHIGNKELQKITPQDLINVLDQWISENKLSMARHGYTYLNTFFNQALKMGEIDKNPMNAIPKPRTLKPEKKAMTVGEIEKFMNVLTDPWEKTYFRLAFVTGLRKGELSGLRVRDIDFVRNSIKIVRSYAFQNKLGTYSDLKNHTARNIDLDDYTLSLLKAHLDDLQVLAEKFGRNREFDDPLFPKTNQVGLGFKCKPMNPDTWANRMKRICKQANIDRYTLHEIRHTMATLLIVNSGVDIMTVSRRMGHADRGFTLNQYGHLSDSSQEVATEKLGNVLPN